MHCSYTVASKCSRYHFVSEKYKIMHEFKLHFLQSSLLVQLCTSVSDRTGVGNIPGSHFLKAFQLFRCILKDAISVIKAPSLQYWLPSKEQVKISCIRSGKFGGCFSAVTLFFAKKLLAKTDQCAGALSWRRNQLFALHFGGGVFSDRFPKATRMSMYVSLFTAAISVNCANEFRELFEATACNKVKVKLFLCTPWKHTQKRRDSSTHS